ncbi:Nn.00g010360.m01.CDS01 [Neocucurbitaria sp. VM-36]
MALESNEDREQHEEHAANVAHADAAHREAYDYWGYLFKKDKCGTPLLDRLLKGIAEVISKKFEPSESPDLTPSQLAAWYRDVGGDYNVLFTETPPSSIAFIYRSLGAFHSLQPAPKDDGYGSPTIPALKKQGFVTWQTIQLLLGPEEHVPFLQKAVEKDDVIDPETGSTFPKILPKECFPDRPDDAMETWYQGVAARLKREAEEEANGVRVTDEPGPRTSTDLSGDGSSADERHGAFKYFEDPMYRRSRPRPSFMRHVSKQPARPIEDSARAVTSRVRHMLNPFGGRKKSVPGRYESDGFSDEDATPIAAVPPQALRYPSHKRPHPPRRDDSLSTTDSDSDLDRPPSRRRTPPLRHRRSHEPPTSPLEYFPAYYEAGRRYSHQHDPSRRTEGRASKATSPQPVYGPTQSPMFATHVAQLEARNYYDRRPAMPARTSYRAVPQNVKWGSSSVPVSPPREGEAPYVRDHGRERNRHGDRERDGDGSPYDMGGSSGSRSRRRRSTEDAAYPRERERGSGRTRSHDRVKDEWDDRDGSRERDRSRDDSRGGDRERERDGRLHRYVSGVQDGVSGRRYPTMNGPY